MARLGVTLAVVMEGERQAVLSGSIIDSDMETRATFSLQGGATEYFDLPEGDYTVQLSLPSGRSVARGVRITDDKPRQIELGPAEGSVPRWLAWSNLSGDAPQRRRIRVGSDRGTQKSIDSEPRRAPRVKARDAGPPPGFHPKEGIWQRFLEFRDGRWKETEWAGSEVTTDGTIWKFRMFADFGQLLAVQIGGLGIPWRFSLVPPGGAEILVQRGEEQHEAQRGLQVVVNSTDFRAQAMLSYLAQGDYVSLMAVGEGLMDDAENMLFSKRRDPMGAAAGGYFLLVSENYDRLHNWPDNFANWIDWLPDSAILHGWQLMKQPGAQDPGQALGRFLEAVKRGIPVFTVGLRYLYDALDYANRQLGPGDAGKADVQSALDTVTGWAQAADWTSTYTTLFGAGPEKPDLLSRSGLPWDWSGLQFLPEIDPGSGLNEVSEPYPPVAGTSHLLLRATVVVRPEADHWNVTLQRGAGGDQVKTESSLDAAVAKARALAAFFAPSRLAVFRDEETVDLFEIF